MDDAVLADEREQEVVGNRGHARTEIVRSRRALERLGSEWDRLARRQELPMLSHAWVLSCAETLYDEEDLHVVTAYVDGTLAGAAPLVATKRAGHVHLELIGSSILYEPSGLLYDSPEALEAVIRAAIALCRPVVLARIASNSAVVERFASLARFVTVRPVSGIVGVPIVADWSDYFAALSSRRRYDVRRARRRAEEAGVVSSRVISPRPDDVPELFDELARVEASGWKGRNGSSLKQRPDLRRFFLDYADSASKTGSIRFGILKVNDNCIAAQLMVEYASRLWVLKIGYDEAWSRCSPGSQSVFEGLRYAFERRLQSYEFLGSDEPWLHGWKTETRPLSTVLYYPSTLRGMSALTADVAVRGLAKVTSGRGWKRASPRHSEDDA